MKELVLLGGGHSHALVLKQWGTDPLPGVRLTLLTEAAETPYSGMLPGHVAGFYPQEACYLNLRSLARFAQAQLSLDQAIGLDLEQQRVICAGRPPVSFDVLSIDIGSTPKIPQVPGASEYSIPAKPIGQFLQRWQQVLSAIAAKPFLPIRLAVVGGGAGGVELVLAMQRQIQESLRQAQEPLERLEIHLFQRDAQLLPTHARGTRDRLYRLLKQRGIQVHLGETVSEVQPHRVICASGLSVVCDYSIWVTQATAPHWLADSGLTVDEQGFIQVNASLQSVSHPQLFAAGDIASLVSQPLPKAGVFAVREAQPLLTNLKAVFQQEPLQAYKPQKHYLSLIGTSEAGAVEQNRAIASWGLFSLGPYRWLWRRKDRIDQEFMEQFRELASPEIPVVPAEIEITREQVVDSELEPGAQSLIAQVWERIRQERPQPVGGGLSLEVPALPENIMLQPLGSFRSRLSDPYRLGQVVAQDQLTTAWVRGKQPPAVTAIATLPPDWDSPEPLYQLICGLMAGLGSTRLVSARILEGTTFAVGLVLGETPGDRGFEPMLQPGQALILTKALGAGTLLTAPPQQIMPNAWIDAAIATMMQSNHAALSCLRDCGATAVTQIGSLGLVGHLLPLLSQARVELYLANLPVVRGAIASLSHGFSGTLQANTLQFNATPPLDSTEKFAQHPHYPFLFDPQLSGAVLAAIPPENLEACLTQLQDLGYTESRWIGSVLAPATGRLIDLKLPMPFPVESDPWSR